MKFVTALRKARPFIDSEEDGYICDALARVGAYEWAWIVQDQLAPRLSYEGWLNHFHPAIHARMDADAFREGRLQWIDHMIAEEVKKGRK